MMTNNYANSSTKHTTQRSTVAPAYTDQQGSRHSTGESGLPSLEALAVLTDALEAKDPYTRDHCSSVAHVAVLVGRHLGWEGLQLDHLHYAALLHDVGKIGIPDDILLKPARLLPEEYEAIQCHAKIGSDLINQITSLSVIAPIILHHHERFDGLGYPHGLCGDEIPLASRILGVVDAFDAMTSPRPYREALSLPEAMAELHRYAGSQFDPDVVVLVSEVLDSDLLKEMPTGREIPISLASMAA